VELSADYHDGGFVLSAAARAGIEASRLSFINVWSAIGRPVSLPFVDFPAASSIATMYDGYGTQLFTTASLVMNLKTSGRLIPYVTAGAGMVTNRAYWLPPSAFGTCSRTRANWRNGPGPGWSMAPGAQ